MFFQQGLPKSVLPKIPEKSADVKSVPHVLFKRDIPEKSVVVKSATHVLSKRVVPEKSEDVKSAPHVQSKRDNPHKSVAVKSAPHVLSKRRIPEQNLVSHIISKRRVPGDEFKDQKRILGHQVDLMMPLFRKFQVLDNPKEEKDNIHIKMHDPR